jgi:hypothetical protein
VDQLVREHRRDRLALVVELVEQTLVYHEVPGVGERVGIPAVIDEHLRVVPDPEPFCRPEDERHQVFGLPAAQPSCTGDGQNAPLEDHPVDRVEQPDDDAQHDGPENRGDPVQQSVLEGPQKDPEYPDDETEQGADEHPEHSRLDAAGAQQQILHRVAQQGHVSQFLRQRPLTSYSAVDIPSATCEKREHGRRSQRRRNIEPRRDECRTHPARIAENAVSKPDEHAGVVARPSRSESLRHSLCVPHLGRFGPVVHAGTSLRRLLRCHDRSHLASGR